MRDLHLRDCDHVRADPAEVRVLDLAVIAAFESDLLDSVDVILQKFFVSWIVGPFCEPNFIHYFPFHWISRLSLPNSNGNYDQLVHHMQQRILQRLKSRRKIQPVEKICECAQIYSH